MRKLLICLILIVVSTSPLWAVGNRVGKGCTISWDEPAVIEPDLGGYKLYIGAESGKYTSVFNKPSLISINTMTCLEAGIQTDGQYYIALTAYDTTGNESGFSNELPFIMDAQAPAARGVLRITMP